jgi:ABC-type nitrate/sulfonate/bicarbonate transport system substrate-binding protein
MRRRDVIGGAGILGTTTLLGVGVPPGAAEPPPETTSLRLDQRPSICAAPQYAAEELLRAEGFTDLQYVKTPGAREMEPAFAAGDVHITLHFAAPTLIVRRYPVATKRALRAILKGVDICAADPGRMARTLVDKGYARRE